MPSANFLVTSVDKIYCQGKFEPRSMTRLSIERLLIIPDMSAVAFLKDGFQLPRKVPNNHIYCKYSVANNFTGDPVQKTDNGNGLFMSLRHRDLQL